MARSHSRRQRGRRSRSPHVAESIAGYTRVLDISATAAANNGTTLQAIDVEGVENGDSEPGDVNAPTVNRKILRVAGKAFFSAGLARNQYAVAQFCLRAAPRLEGWPAVAVFDPFEDGPGHQAYEGMPSPRPFCRRTFVLSTADADPAVAALIQESHMVTSKAERLLRPGWKLQAALYVRGSSGVKVRWTGLLRTVVAG